MNLTLKLLASGLALAAFLVGPALATADHKLVGYPHGPQWTKDALFAEWVKSCNGYFKCLDYKLTGNEFDGYVVRCGTGLGNGDSDCASAAAAWLGPPWETAPISS